MSLLQPLDIKHFVFKPSFPLHMLSVKDLKTVNYVHRNLGVVHWSTGEDDVSDFTNSLPAASIILCNGLEKSLLLKSIFPLCQLVNANIAISNLELTTPPSDTATIIGCFHRHKLCSLIRVYQLYKYFINVSGQLFCA